METNGPSLNAFELAGKEWRLYREVYYWEGGKKERFIAFCPLRGCLLFNANVKGIRRKEKRKARKAAGDGKEKAVLRLSRYLQEPKLQ